MDHGLARKALLLGLLLVLVQLALAGLVYASWLQANPGAPLGRPYIDVALLDDSRFTGIAIAGILALFIGSYVAYSQHVRMAPFPRFVLAYTLREVCGFAGILLAFLYQNPHLCLPFVFAAVLAMVRGLATIR